MHTSILALTTFLSLAVAQSSTAASSSSTCAAQPVLDACLASTQALASGCSTSDYSCLCAKYTAVLTCFDQCPNDARQSSVLSQKDSACTNASVYSSTGTSNSTVSASSSKNAAGNAASTTSSSTASTTRSAGSTSATANAGVQVKEGTGLMMGVLGLVGIML